MCVKPRSCSPAKMCVRPDCACKVPMVHVPVELPPGVMARAKEAVAAYAVMRSAYERGEGFWHNPYAHLGMSSLARHVWNMGKSKNPRKRASSSRFLMRHFA
jgi:hypothetical protein